MSRLRKSARKSTTRKPQAVGLSTNAQMGNSDSLRRHADEDMQDGDSQQGEYQNGEPQQNEDTQHENNDTPQNTPDDSDSDAIEIEDQLQTIKTNWDITHLEDIIQDAPATWFRGTIGKDDDGHVIFEDATIKAAYYLAKVSKDKKDYVISKMAEKWVARDKARVPGDRVGANWTDKQKNMRIDFGRLREEMRNGPAKDVQGNKRKSPKKKGTNNQEPPPKSKKPQKEKDGSPEVEMTDANILNGGAEPKQPNNTPRTGQQNPKPTPPPNRPDSPVQQGGAASPGPPRATQASAHRPNRVTLIQRKLRKATQYKNNAANDLDKAQDAKTELANKRDASAADYADADLNVALAEEQVRKKRLEEVKLEMGMQEARYEEEGEPEEEN